MYLFLFLLIYYYYNYMIYIMILRNPTARLFRTTFRLNTKMNLMKLPKQSNCQPDDDTNLMCEKNINLDLEDDNDRCSSNCSNL
jgi:hypothetical protein